MTITKKYGYLLSLLACMACSNQEKDNNSTEADPVRMALSETNDQPGDSASAPAPASPVMINSVTPVPGSVQVPPVQNTGAVAPGTNPPHGQPGHRCELAVGAPLNSAPATAPAPGSSPASPMHVNSQGTGNVEIKPLPPGSSPLSQPAPTITPAPAATKTAPGMNPPHGEPGHDCSIAVGAPLKK